MKRVAVVFETDWDRKQLAACRSTWAERFDVIFLEPTDEDCPADLDIMAFLDEACRTLAGVADGVLSSSDYPGATIAAAIATRLGLSGSDPRDVIAASHKYASRLLQRDAVPEAAPAFALVDPDAPWQPPSVGFPCFVKPVKGAFSLLARKVVNAGELAAFLARPAVGEFRSSYMAIFNTLVARLTDLGVDGRYFLAEELITGRQVTVEGYCAGEHVEILGIVDSVMYPGTSSFARFDYPSSLEEGVQRRMGEIAARAVRALGLRQTLFNMEMAYDAGTDAVKIIEINPRICGQFADLYEKVDGTNAYEIALALAAGEAPPRNRRRGRYGVASSCPLRIFEASRVVRAPGPAEVAAAESLYPHTMVWTECAAGETLADFEAVEDGRSYRYAIVNLGAATRDDLVGRLASVVDRLGFEFAPA